MSVEKVRADALPALIKQGDVAILVPDPSDPSGMAKIPRRVTGAFCTDTAQTRGRWTLHFDQTHRFTAGLVTAGHHEYELTSPQEADLWTPPEVPQPPAQPVRPAYVPDPLAAAATEDGLNRGEQHAAWVASYGPAPKPSVPDEYASVDTYWIAGFDEGVQKYEDEDHDWPST